MTEQDEKQETHESAKPYQDALKKYREEIGDKWDKQRENLDKLYSRDERADSADREYAIFWANIEVLKPATYSRPPVPVVVARFKPAPPHVSEAAEALERCLITTFEQSDMDGCMVEVRDEYLRYSRGSAWVRLGTKPDGTPRVEFDFVNADDFAHDAARTWREVGGPGKRAWLTKDEGRARFDQYLAKYGKSFDQVPVKRRDENSATDDPEDKAPVWEWWDKKKNRVVWFSEDFDCLLDVQPPFLDLTSFWPCPRPAYGTLVPKTLKPVPDIRQYKDQIEEINEYTARIAALSESLRMKGFYPAGAGEISDAIETAIKNLDDNAILVPISNWAQFGGSAPKDMIAWLPVTEVLKLVQGLVELRRVVIDDVYQITGIADIVRGQSDPNETLGAQQLKSQWGSLRIRSKQGEMSRFARDMARIAGEIIAENFPKELIAEMAQMPVSDEAYAFLQNDRARGFLIEIETDSTIQPDEDAEKTRRTEFLTAVGGLFQQAAPIVMQAPQLGPFMGEVLKFGAQGFRAGRPLEGAIDNMVQMLGQMAQQAMQPQPPDPVAEAKAKEAAVKLEGTKATTQATVVKANASMAETQMKMQASAQEHGQTMEQMAAEAAMPQQRPN